MNTEYCCDICLQGNEKEITREEETTVILQLDILRGIHSDLHLVGGEINQLLGFQMLVNLVTNVVIVCMFGFYTVMGALDSESPIQQDLPTNLHC